MSRSRRKTPISGMSMKDSDKPFKAAEHRRARRKLKSLDLTEDEPPAERTYGNPWASPKDGKQWIDPKRWPKVFRK